MKTRELLENEVVFHINVTEDTELSVDQFGGDNPEEDAEMVRELQARLNTGDTWAWCTVEVVATWKSWKGTDVLGGCSYKDEQEFRQDGYFDDMKARELEELNRIFQEDANRLEEICQPMWYDRA